MAIEPLYSLEVAAELIPMPVHNLGSFLATHKDEYPPRFNHAVTLGKGGQAPRMLTETECLKIREAIHSAARRGGETRRKMNQERFNRQING